MAMRVNPPAFFLSHYELRPSTINYYTIYMLKPPSCIVQNPSNRWPANHGYKKHVMFPEKWPLWMGESQFSDTSNSDFHGENQVIKPWKKLRELFPLHFSEVLLNPIRGGLQEWPPFFPECVARVPVSLWGSGGWGCVRSTLRSRSQPFATVRAIPVWPCLWEVLQRWSFLEVSDVSLLRFAWQAWHFMTFRRVVQRVENRFAWQAQYFCDVFRRCVAVFVAGAALWTCPSSFFVAGAAL